MLRGIGHQADEKASRRVNLHIYKAYYHSRCLTIQSSSLGIRLQLASELPKKLLAMKFHTS